MSFMYLVVSTLVMSLCQHDKRGLKSRWKEKGVVYVNDQISITYSKQ